MPIMARNLHLVSSGENCRALRWIHFLDGSDEYSYLRVFPALRIKLSLAALLIFSFILIATRAHASDQARQGGSSSTQMQGYHVQSLQVVLDPSDPATLRGVSFEVHGQPIATQVQVSLITDGPWVDCSVKQEMDHAVAECMLLAGDHVSVQDWDEFSVVALSG